MIFVIVFVLLVYPTTTTTAFLESDIHLSPSNSTESGHFFHDKILCRFCGNDITYSSNIISKISPSSYYSYHDSLFSKDEILVQMLRTDLGLPFYMITAKQSNCAGIGEWEETNSWFPGYHWKQCVCPDCGALVGWVFEPINPHYVDGPEVFFGLVLETLISESFVKSFAVLPGEQSNY